MLESRPPFQHHDPTVQRKVAAQDLQQETFQDFDRLSAKWAVAMIGVKYQLDEPPMPMPPLPMRGDWQQERI